MSSFFTPGRSTFVIRRLSFSKTSTFGDHIAGWSIGSAGQRTAKGSSNIRSSSEVIWRSNPNGVGATAVANAFFSRMEILLRLLNASPSQPRRNSHALAGWCLSPADQTYGYRGGPKKFREAREIPRPHARHPA